MLKAPHPGAYNSATTLHNHAEVPMPQYEYFCHACKKTFSKVLTLAEYEEGEVLCPHCGSNNVEQSWSVFSAITSKKSA
jgi:putative FmdB family regulatory protein